MNFFAAIQWRPQLPPLWCGVLILFMGGWLYWTYRRMLLRFPRHKSLFLLSPKLLVMTLLIFALFEPVRESERRESLQGRLVVVTDVSSSMDVVDDHVASRRTRTVKIYDSIKSELPSDIALESFEFDTQLRPAGAAFNTNSIRGTDLGGCLVALSERHDISGALGVILLTDGGDEPVRAVALPPVPLTIVGIGTDPTNWNDIAIAAVDAPVTVEKDTQFEISADIIARGTLDLKDIKVKLEREQTGKWISVASQTVDLTHKRLRIKFPVTSPGAGRQRYRVIVEPVSGELSALNNERVVTVDVQKKAVHVLFFTRELGMDFKMLRSEIGRDPGIAFTSLYRTLSERFTVQGDRVAGDESLEAGFPTDVKTLQLFDCVIIGSFSASEWTQSQFEALEKYVKEGGAVVFLGGENSFGRGGYAGTPLAPLLPWQIDANEPELACGTFAVTIPAAGSGQAIVAGLDDVLAQGAILSSVNEPGSLKTGATPLLSVNVNGRNVAVVAIQSYSRGHVLGIASNTFWEWARKSDALRNAYGLFWRQAVRDLTGKLEGGRYFSVRWDKDHYLPGEQATADIRLTGLNNAQSVRLTSTLSINNQMQSVAVDSKQGRANEYAALCRFKERGEYVFRLVAYQGETVLDTYEKVLPVAPPLAEGSKLEVDAEALTKLAESTGGTYLPESKADELAPLLKSRFLMKSVVTETPLVTAGPQFALLVLVLLLIEWWLRRKANLI